MKLEFIFTGKTTEKWIEEGCSHYLNRIKKYVKAEITIVNIPVSGLPIDVQKKKESELIFNRLSAKDFLVLLDESGKEYTSVGFADQMNKLISSGKAKIVIIVGGPYGSDSLLKKKANLLLSFSKMTFTHQMIRLLLLEQVYRAMTILRNEKYHH